MKKSSSFMIIVLLVYLILSACDQNSSEKQNQTTVSETTAISETRETTTQKPTEKPLEEPTKAPNEDDSKKANAAYLNYIESHTEWFDSYESSPRNNIFALYDVNSDDVDEFFYVHPNTEKSGRLNLGIITYDGEVKELYDDIIVNLPGAESKYSVFVGEDDKLYSIMNKELWGHVIRFDIEGDNFSADVLAKSDAFHLAKPEDAKCTIDGSPVSYEDYYNYMRSIISNAKKYIMLSHNQIAEHNDLSMTYYGVVEYLENHS